jgi:2-polyprenyl-6-methoxyphenol hydroxylase-like FAD-dependent oxidoreductase
VQLSIVRLSIMSSNLPNRDIVIVGAGPTGLTLALGLAKKGFSVAILEKHGSRLPYSRAMFLNSETLKLLDDFGLREQFRAAGRLVNGVSVRCDGGDDSTNLTWKIGDLYSNPYHPILISQVKIEEIVEASLNFHGVFVQYNTAYLSHNIVEGGILVSLVSSENDYGSPFQIKCRFLLGADGFSSPVRRALNIPFLGSTMTEEMVAADITVQSCRLDTDINVWTRPSGFILAIRMSHDRVRLAASHSSLTDEMLALFDVHSIDWISNFNVHHFHATEHGSNGVYIAGDAVHVHSPIGGRGMNMGVADACALAQAVEENDFAKYNSRRLPITSAWVSSNKVLSYFATRQLLFFKVVRMAVVYTVKIVGAIGLGRQLARFAFEALSGVHIR